MNRTFLRISDRETDSVLLVAMALTLSLALCPVWAASADETEAPAPQVAGREIMMNFKDAPLSTVLSYLSEVAGLIVVQQVEVQGRVSIISLQPLNVQEAVALLNTVLKDQGYSAVRMGRTLKIISLQDVKKESIPVRSGNDPELIELTDEIITQVIPVRFVDAVRLRDDLNPLIASYAQMSANASSNALIVTDTSANIRRIVEIVRALDTHMSAVAEIKVFQLDYADATDAARLLNEIFAEERPTTGQPQGQGRGRARFFMGGGRQGQAAQESAGPSQKVTASADSRTNTLVVSAPPDMMAVVESLIKELDANPAEEQGTFLYRLKNAKAVNLAKVLTDLLGGTTQTTAGGAGAQRQRAQQAAPAAAAAAAGLYGQVDVVADEDTNSLLIMTASKNFDRVKELLAELDRPVPQVLIKVLIAEVTHDKTIDIGTEFSALNLSAGGTAPDVGSNSLQFRLIEADVNATLNALEAAGKLDVLSRPYILASDNQEMTIPVRYSTNTRR